MANETSKHVLISQMPHVCKKCEKPGKPIGVIGEVHTTLYCPFCGMYIKHANVREAMEMSVETIHIKEGTPERLIYICNKSEGSI